MLLHRPLWIFIIGLLGGCLGEFLTLYELRKNDPGTLPTYLRSPFYWAMSLVMAAGGGGLALVYGFNEVQAMVVLNIGGSAPLIIKSLISGFSPPSNPKIN